MTYSQAVQVLQGILLPAILKRFGLEGCRIEPIDAHEGGRNILYRCTNADGCATILRISYLRDRSMEDYLAETEFVHHLAKNSASVADVLPSKNGALVEGFSHGGQAFYASLFACAKGDCIAAHGYRYREGAPLSEYHYNCGKVLGKMHALSKRYKPEHRRKDFFALYTPERIASLLPEGMPALQSKLETLLDELQTLPRNEETYGMVHFDYSDGNYNIDYATGEITVFDFDNACYCWYLYDLANLWAHAVGWIQFEPDAAKRESFMQETFGTILEGYRSQTTISEEMLAQLPLLLKAELMENILDEFQVLRQEGEELECDAEQRYRIKCMMEDIPYHGFFSPIYDSKAPFAWEGEL